ncbi:MAG: GNAT family N-acetyltransferase [Anaerolineaceae bacterium]|nr:MAG: GNAT family N-acetyltransferase [Anaerolineaceae bacterium]
MAQRTLLIREFHYPQDYESAERLWKDMEKGVHFSRSDVPAEIEKKLTRDPDLFLVAESDGELVGTVIGGFDGRRGMVYHLAVAQAHRRRGVAEVLMREIEKRLVDRGCIRALLLVHADNVEARGLYEKQDWVLLADNVVYSKDIA